MLTITITWTAPDSLIAKCEVDTAPFSLMHLLALGQALLEGTDPHEHRYRGEASRTAPVLVAQFPGVGQAGLTWWWSGLTHPREQIRAYGAYLMGEASNQFLFVALAEREAEAAVQAQQGRRTLVLPGYPWPMAGQRNPESQ